MTAKFRGIIRIVFGLTFLGIGTEILLKRISSAGALPGNKVVNHPKAPMQQGTQQGISSLHPGPRKNHNQPDRATSWATFQRRFGPELKPEFSPYGDLVAVRGPAGLALPDGFETQNFERVVSRAREIVSAAEDLLGVSSRLPLTELSVNPGPLSAQIYFSETYQGIPVSPGGVVRVDLGKNGELLSIDSSYIAHFEVVGEEKITLENARTQALLAVYPQGPDAPANLAAPSERRIIWVDGNQGYRAYEFTVAGQRIVIDARSGQVLERKDLRIT